MHSALLGHGMSSPDHLHIKPYTDVVSISGVLHLVWPLLQSLSSMVEPNRSQNSSWHSLWDLRGTQACSHMDYENTYIRTYLDAFQSFNIPSIFHQLAEDISFCVHSWYINHGLSYDIWHVHAIHIIAWPWHEHHRNITVFCLMAVLVWRCPFRLIFLVSATGWTAVVALAVGVIGILLWMGYGTMGTGACDS